MKSWFIPPLHLSPLGAFLKIERFLDPPSPPPEKGKEKKLTAFFSLRYIATVLSPWRFLFFSPKLAAPLFSFPPFVSFSCLVALAAS